ncbi:MAG TPA: hypothetical protein VJT74_08290 [Pyrinomonadaceae bacterium]|nr:hypothetical protein [Pyrinomonadaceae bacterium]
MSQANGQIRIPLPGKKKQQQPPLPTDTAAMIALLNEQGPQFPQSFDTSRFTITTLIKSGWSFVCEYELATKSLLVITLTAHTDRGPQIFVKELPGMAEREGEHWTERFQIPEQFGDKLVPGFIRIEALTNLGGEKKPTDFQLYGIGLGVERVAFEALEPLAGQVVPASYSLQLPDVFSSLKLFQSEVISGPTFNPDTINVSAGNKITYRFQPRDKFGRWAADFRAITKQTNSDGSVVRKTKWVRTDQFDEEIGPREVVRDWDGKDRKGNISRGEYRLTIRAWWSAFKGGKAVVRLADKNIFIR